MFKTVKTKRIAAAATTNATVVKADKGVVYGWTLFNVSAADIFLKLYNKATTPDENDTPIMTIGLGTKDPSNVILPNPIWFDQGIAYRIVTGVADNSTTAPSANDLHGALLWL